MELAPQVFENIEHTRFYRDIQAGRGLVHDDQIGPQQQRHSDDHALLHPAAQLVRVAAEDIGRIGHSHEFQHLQDTLAGLAARGGFMRENDFAQLALDGQRRIQRRLRVLVNHRHPVTAQRAQLAARHAHHILIFEQDRAADLRAWRQVTHHGQSHRRFAAARFADQPIRLPALHAQRDAAHRPDQPTLGRKTDVQVLQFENWHKFISLPIIHPPAGYRRSPATRYKTPGTAAPVGTRISAERAPDTMRPQSGCGSGTPSPKKPNAPTANDA